MASLEKKTHSMSGSSMGAFIISGVAAGEAAAVTMRLLRLRVGREEVCDEEDARVRRVTVEAAEVTANAGVAAAAAAKADIR
mmetsp:Transcript_6620/g.16944  ORF Transcript_6620/g.16944 Transcript_6620/m.16944 type:complete len:82 (+) Transcript_6620:740-985(+)